MRIAILLTLLLAGFVRADEPYVVERFERDGPTRGVVVKISLDDPRVHVSITPSSKADPDGDGPCITTLDTVRNVAVAHDFEIAINASFFAAPGVQNVGEKQIRYFRGNGCFPVGWLVVDGKTLAKASRPGMATLAIDAEKRVTIYDELEAVSESMKFVVSGNKRLLKGGEVVEHENDLVRHPRTALGVSEDGRTLILLTVDGRRPDWSRGTTYRETAELLKEFGAAEGLNLDGGGSSTLVIKDPATGVHAVANRPSDGSIVFKELQIERPVSDVIGIDIIEGPAPAAAPTP